MPLVRWTEAHASATLRLGLGLGIACLVRAHGSEFQPAFVHWLLIAFFASNFPLLTVGGFKRLERRVGLAVLVADTLIASSLVYSIAGDLTLTLFLILLVVAAGNSRSLLGLSATGVAATYVWLKFESGAPLDRHVFLTVPFFYAVALYYGHVFGMLSRTSVEEKILKEHRELRLLTDLLKEVGQSLEPAEVLDTAVRHVAAMLEAPRVSVFEVRSGEAKVRVLASTDAIELPLELDRTRYPELSLKVPAGEPLLIEDVSRNRLVRAARTELLDVGFRSLVLQELQRLDRSSTRLVLHAACATRELEPDQVNFLHSVAVAIRGGLSSALRHQRERDRASDMHRLFRHAPEVILAFDGSGRVRRANAAAERVFRASQQGLVGKRWSDLVSGVAWPEATGDPDVPFDLRDQPIRRGDDTFSRADLSLAAIPDVPDGGWVLVGQERAEEVVKDRTWNDVDRLRGIGELASGIAHELNNAWTAVLGHVQILARTHAESADVIGHLEPIRVAAERGAALVSKLQRFGRPGMNEVERTDVKTCLSVVLELYRYRLDEARVVVHREGDELPSIVVAPHRLEMAFLNLLQNAVQAMKKRSEGRRLVVRTERSGNSVDICFTDNGPGVPPAMGERIFEPFFSLHGEDAPGLGLSIARGVIEEHGGTLEWVPTEEGACFRVRLPVSAAALRTASDATPLAS